MFSKRDSMKIKPASSFFVYLGQGTYREYLCLCFIVRLVVALLEDYSSK